MNHTIGTPEGTRDRLFAECASFRQVEQAATAVFRRQGYCEMTTPNMEYYDLISRAGHPIAQEQMLKIIDRTGKILVMRPDVTVAMGRVAATKLRGLPLPLRLYYNQMVFRSDDVNTGARSEIDQCGVELIGAPGLRGDLEVISLAIAAMEACGLTGYHIEIGHAGFFEALLEGLGADGDQKDRLGTLVETKEFTAYDQELSAFGDVPDGPALRALPRLYGGPEILRRAKELCRNEAALEVLGYLETLWGVLETAGLSDRVRFDLGLIQTIEYYTGIVFRGYGRGAESAVLSGGRYDRLIGCFGEDMPATGFALDVEAVTKCLDLPEHRQPETLVWYDLRALGQARALVDSLPAGSAMLSCANTPIDAELEARGLGAKTLILLDGERRQEVRL